MNIYISELEEAAKKRERYYFFCYINGKVNLYSSLADELVRKFAGKDIVRKDFYEFYIEYSTGKLYKEAPCNAVDEICHLYREDKNTIDDLISKARSGRLAHLHWKQLQIISEVNWRYVEGNTKKHAMKKYVVRSNEAMVEYPALCKIRVALSKLYEAAAKQESYTFDCRINGKNYSYLVPADVLLQTFICKRGTVDLQECVFYIGYATGALYCTPSQRGEDTIYRLNPASKEVSSSADDFPPFESDGWKGYNICTSAKPEDANPKRCWMNIGAEKLGKYADDDQWLFDTNVGGERRVYCALVKEVRETLERNNVAIIENGTPRYSFYIDYKEGALYATLSSDEKLLMLSEMKDEDQYVSMMKRIPDKGMDFAAKREAPNFKTTTDIDMTTQYDTDDMKIGERVRTLFIPCLERAYKEGRLTGQEVQELQEWKLASFPVLRREADIPEQELRDRYYKTPVELFGKRYRVCNHWYIKNEPDLQRWMERLGRLEGAPCLRVCPQDKNGSSYAKEDFSNDADFPEFKEYRDGSPISTTKTRQDYPEPRCRIDIDVEKLARFADETKWIFDCNVQDERRVYYTTVDNLKTSFKRENVESGGKYQFSIDYTAGVLYSNTYRHFLLKLKKVADGKEYMSLMQRKPDQVIADYPPFVNSGKNYNICTSETPDGKNPNRCWMNIVVEKLEKFEDRDPWLFDCCVDGKRYVYYALVRDVKSAFKDGGANFMEAEAKYGFWIDYSKGVIYDAVYDSTGIVLLRLKSVSDSDEYVRLKKPVPKK